MTLLPMRESLMSTNLHTRVPTQTETTLLKIQNDIYIYVDFGKAVTDILLDLSAIFEITD